MEDLRNLLAVVDILVDRDGVPPPIHEEKYRARYESLHECPLQQKLLGNLIAARERANRAGLGIRLYNDDEEQGTPVEDIFLELTFDLLPKIVACLVVVSRCVQLRAAAVADIKLGPNGEVLSKEELAKVRQLVWFVVCLGIHPFLELQLHAEASKYTSSGRRSSVLERKQKMMVAVGYIRCLKEQEELIPILRSHAIHCPALAVLLEQIICPQPNCEDPQAEQYAIMKSQARTWLDGLMEGSRSFRAMPQLFVLQNAAQRSLALPSK